MKSHCNSFLAMPPCAACRAKDRCPFYRAVVCSLRATAHDRLLTTPTIETWHSAIGLASHHHALQLAQLLGTSLRNLQYKFAAELRLCPQAWLDNLRLLEAERLLLTGAWPKEIAAELGFKHLSHLCKQFKKRFNMSMTRHFSQKHAHIRTATM